MPPSWIFNKPAHLPDAISVANKETGLIYTLLPYGPEGRKAMLDRDLGDYPDLRDNRDPEQLYHDIMINSGMGTLSDRADAFERQNPTP